MKTVLCDNLWREKWDEFVQVNASDFGLLQSWAWGVFVKSQKSKVHKVYRMAVVDESDEILAAAQIIRQPLPLGRCYFYIPRGPIISQKSKACDERSRTIKSQKLELEVLFSEIKKLAKKEGAIFLRFDPAWTSACPVVSENFDHYHCCHPRAGGEPMARRWDPRLLPSFANDGIRGDDRREKGDDRRKIGSAASEYFYNLYCNGQIIDRNLKFAGQVQPRQTLILDLTKTEEQLLAQMKPKTRYNIKVAQKHGVEILSSGLPPAPSLRQGGGALHSVEKFNDFWSLMQKTASRQEIVPHKKEYYQNLLSVLGEKNIAQLWLAKCEGKVITANIMIFFGQWAVYLHGASDYEYRDKMAPYLLQWEAILAAKKQGKKYYDFWGVDEKKWPGVTRFKTGFAPDQPFTEYAGAWDEAYSKLWYTAYKRLKGSKF